MHKGCFDAERQAGGLENSLKYNLLNLALRASAWSESHGLQPADNSFAIGLKKLRHAWRKSSRQGRKQNRPPGTIAHSRVRFAPIGPTRAAFDGVWRLTGGARCKLGLSSEVYIYGLRTLVAVIVASKTLASRASAGVEQWS